MDTVVDDVAGDDEIEARHVQHAGVVGVAVADLDDGQFVALQLNAICGDGDGGNG